MEAQTSRIAQPLEAEVNHRYPPIPSKAEVHTFRQVDLELRAWVFRATSREPTPALIFFFGGAWVDGTPAQFVAHAEYLASRGVTGILVDYRVATRSGSTVRESLDDARHAWSWVVEHAVELNLDPARIGAAGGSAGGLLAAMLGLQPDASARPSALVLFNPVLVLASEQSELSHLNALTVVEIVEGWGLVPEEYSPIHHLDLGLPATLIMHGREDSVVPFAASVEFARRAAENGAVCSLVGYDELDHGFFNIDVAGNWTFLATMRRADQFLGSLGWVVGAPTLRGEIVSAAPGCKG